MASDVDICNLALSHLGDKAQITDVSATEGSIQGEYCYVYYSKARDVVLSHPKASWSFAKRRVNLALLVDTIDPWAYMYTRPNNCLRIIEVLAQGGDTPQEFETETLDTGVLVLLTNMEDAQVRYIHAITDTTKFSHPAVMAISYMLAGMIAGPLLKGKTGSQKSVEMYKLAEYWIGVSAAEDATNQARGDRHNFTPSGISARS